MDKLEDIKKKWLKYAVKEDTFEAFEVRYFAEEIANWFINEFKKI